MYRIGSDGTIVRAPNGPRGQGAYVDSPRKRFAGGAGLLSTARDYRVDPEAKLVIVLMIQVLPNTTDLGRKFPTLVYQALMER